MSTKPLDGTTSEELYCGCLGCGQPAIYVMKHPAHGLRTVCEKHAFEQWVVDRV
jgi:hypothetical protein